MLLSAALAAFLLAQSPAGPTTVAAPEVAAEGARQRPPIVPELPLEQRAPDGDGAFVWQMVRSVLALGAVLALIYLLFKLGLAKLLPGGALARGGRHVTVLERVALDARNALYVVELASGKRLLLGSSERGISVLEALEAKGSSSQSFEQVLASTQAKGASDV